MAETQTSELSERELEILRLVATGASNKEIAQQLFISANTVKVHLRNIFAKIGATSRTEAAMYAVSIGLVPGIAQKLVREESLAPETLEIEEIARQDTEPGTPAGVPGPAISAASVPERRVSQRLFWPAVLLSLVIILGLGAWVWRRAQQANQPPPPGIDSPRWQQHAELPLARAGLALAAYEDQIYAIGGETQVGVSNEMASYTVGSNTWQDLVPKPTAVADINAAVIGGRIFVPGGRLASGALTDVLEIYDPHQNSWISGARLPVAVSGYALATYEGSLYLFGGWDGQEALASVYEYNPTEDQWVPKTPMPSRRAYAGVAVVSGKIYVIGGYDGKRPLNNNEYYLPDQDDGQGIPWGKGASLPEARYAMGVAVVADIIVVVGGIGEKDVSPLSVEYFTQKNSWVEFGTLGPQKWANLAVVPVGTQIYLLGGRIDGQLSPKNLSYQAIYTLSIPIVR